MVLNYLKATLGHVQNVFSIVNSAFSASEKQRIKGHDFNIIMYINSSTGKVDEVSFEFHKSDPFATIPVSVYRKIETEIKKKFGILRLPWERN